MLQQCSNLLVLYFLELDRCNFTLFKQAAGCLDFITAQEAANDIITKGRGISG
ncbi:hypothetical protein D3C74_488330 [compost metagenome]